VSIKIFIYTAICLTLIIGTSSALYTPPGGALLVQQLRYDPYPAIAGQYLKLWIKVENIGNWEVEDIVCKLESTYPFSLDPNEIDIRTIGRLPAQQVAIVDYQVRVAQDAIEGWNEINFKYKYKDVEWTTAKLRIYVKSEIPDFAIGLIQSSPLNLVPDTDNAKLTIEIQNIGNGRAEMVVAELILREGFKPSQSYSYKANLGTIEAHSSKNAIFYIDVDKTLLPGSYLTDLIIRYKEKNSVEYKNKTLQIELNVKSTPLFEVESIETSRSELAQGDKDVALKLRIKNTGTEEAKSVSVKLLKQAEQPFDFKEKYDYIGNLKPGQSGEAILTFSVNSDALLKTYLLDLEIRYTIDDSVRIVEKTIPIKVSREKTLPIWLYIIPILIILPIGIFAWHKLRRK
jgi:hypothetical protein